MDENVRDEKGDVRPAAPAPNGATENGAATLSGDGYHTTEPAAWTREVVPLQPGDAVLPSMFPGINTVLNRSRLARWLTEFRDDANVAEFLILDILAVALQIDISSTGLADAFPKLGQRPFRLWEYVWLYKTLGLARGGKRVLDLGGAGTHLSMLAALAGNDVESIDINAKFVNAGIACARALGLDRYVARVADMTDLSMYAAESFDIVVSASVLEHLTPEGQAQAMREVARVLKPGGVAGVTFDFGRSAAGANENLPPPHCPPESGKDALRRFVQGDLVVLGNPALEDPVDDSLFATWKGTEWTGERWLEPEWTGIHYTIGALFLGRPPLRTPAPPSVQLSRPTILSRLRIDNIIRRAHVNSIAMDKRGLTGLLASEIDKRFSETLERYGVADSSARDIDQREISELREALGAFVQENARLANAVEELRVTSDLTEASIAKTEATMAEKDAAIEAQRALLGDMQSQIEQRQAELEQELEQKALRAEASERATSQALADLSATNEALQSVYEVLEAERTSSEQEAERRAAEAASLSAELAGLREIVEALKAELEAINNESALGLFVRKALKKMPTAGAKPVFHHGRVTQLVAKGVWKTGSFALRRYQAARLSAARHPRITMVTPVLNGAEHIGETIRSVLAQGYPDLQYIVADGGSTDGTQAIVASFGDRVQLLSQPDRGMYDGVHRGFANGNGEIYGYLNADDVLEPGALLRVGAYFGRHPHVDVVYHEDIVEFNGWRFPNIAQPPRVGVEHILRGHVLFQDGVFFRRRAYDKVGGVNFNMKLAGDALLWVRLARKFKFVRLSDHVSTFRIRAGQLSEQMGAYNEEREYAFGQLRKTIWPTEKLLYKMSAMLTTGWDKLTWRHENDRLFFPIDKGELPPPPGPKPALPAEHPPICPITGEVAERLLFSSPDTRFGDELINYIYYAPKSQLAIVYPRIDEPTLTALYERHYSNPDRVAKYPAERSPYRNYQAKGFLPKLVSRWRLPKKWDPWDDAPWVDRTYEEMMDVIHASGVKKSDERSFLDIGCFNGNLLDRVRRETAWRLAGIEPNEHAAEEARAKGHDVFHAGVERAASVVPLGDTFDIVWLGQAIEHFNDPLAAVLSLRTLVAPNGRLVLSTPNLESAQIDMFGPTWSSWHPPYHRFIFSIKSLQMLAERANMRLITYKTYSHPYWTVMNLMLHQHGLAAAIPHDIAVPQDVRYRALSIWGWSKLLFDPRGKGDYIVAAFERLG